MKAEAARPQFKDVGSLESTPRVQRLRVVACCVTSPLVESSGVSPRSSRCCRLHRVCRPCLAQEAIRGAHRRVGVAVMRNPEYRWARNQRLHR